jgi:hypothetical protein
MAVRAEDLTRVAFKSSRNDFRLKSRAFPTQGSFSLATTAQPIRSGVWDVREADHASLQEQFDALVEQWRADTSHVSQVERRVMHPAYQKIIAMGPRALPLILCELHERPDHWFWALRLLAPEDPVPADFRGTVTEAVQLWIDWGKEAGYLLA